MCIRDRFYTREEVDYDFTSDDRDRLEDGFNMAECEANTTMTFEYSYSGSISAGDFDVWLGASCDVKENRDESKCYQHLDGDTVETRAYLDIEPAWVVESMSSSPSCVEDEGQSDLWLFIMGSDSDETILYQANLAINYDTRPPDAPVDVEASYGEGKVRIDWDVYNENKPEDWSHFVVLCYPSPSAVTPADDASTDVEGEGNGGADPDDAVDDELEDIESEEDVIPDAEEEDAGAEDAAGDTATEDAGTTTDAEEDTTMQDVTESADCPSGGFHEGDDFDNAYVCSGFLGQSTRTCSVTGLENGVAYKFAVVAFDDFRNPSPVSAVVCATPQEVDDFWEVYKKAGGGADEGFCFIATAAYDSPIHPFVKHLKAFRDEILQKVPAGRTLVELYYRHSPAAAEKIEDSPLLKTIVRAALLPAVALAWLSVVLLHHPGLMFALIGLLIIAAGGRYRKNPPVSLLGVVLIFTLACPGTLMAKDKKEDKYKGELRKHKHEGSPQHFAAELKFGPYYPDIDDEFDGAAPFHDVFGSSGVLHGLFELDYQFLRPPGVSLAVGGLIGGFRFEGKALDPETGESSGEDTTLAVMPTHLDIILRVDALMRYTVVPLVPYVKGGLSYYVWWTKSESGVSEIDGEKGRGGTWGWNLQTGLMICLDPLDPRAARTIDNEVGVNNSYIFAEFFLTRIDNFGTGGCLNLSDMTWLIGLALEF